MREISLQGNSKFILDVDRDNNITIRLNYFDDMADDVVTYSLIGFLTCRVLGIVDEDDTMFVCKFWGCGGPMTNCLHKLIDMKESKDHYWRLILDECDIYDL